MLKAFILCEIVTNKGRVLRITYRLWPRVGIEGWRDGGMGGWGVEDFGGPCGLRGKGKGVSHR